MRLEQFRRILGFDEETERILEPHWESALASLPAHVEFLEPSFIRENFPLIGAEETLESRLLATAATAAEIPAARLYAWLLFEAHFIRFDQRELAALPPVESLFGDNAGLLHLLVALGTFPLIRRTLDRLGMPQSQLAEMAQWLRGTIDIYAAGHGGRPGHSLQQLYWMRHYIKGELFRIGRFEFLIHPQQEWSPAIYRRCRDGAVLALCRDGEKDWSRYQTDTSLRRAFHRVHESGRSLTNGGSFVLTEDLDRLEDGFYRNRAVPEAVRQPE